MYLYLSERSPLNSIYTNEDGQVMYKVVTPLAATSRTSTISCVLPNDLPVKGDNTEADTKDRFGHLAQIEHKVVASSILRFGGNEVEAKDYFRKEGWGVYGR